jgi:peptidase E
VARHVREVAALMGSCGALAIAGGNVAVLVHRLRLFGVQTMVRRHDVFAWSAGAMACSEEIVLFHDDPPQGAGRPEVFGEGLGLVRGVLPLPHASKRLRLGDRLRVSTFARRFAPLACVAMDRWRDGAWRRAAGGARRLDASGEVVEMFGP